MKRFALVLCLITLVAPSIWALDAYPLTTVCELYTSTG